MVFFSLVEDHDHGGPSGAHSRCKDIKERLWDNGEFVQKVEFGATLADWK
jgi:hypothetical protein